MDELKEWLRERWGFTALVLLTVVLGLRWWWGRPLVHPVGQIAAADPVQSEPESTRPWTFKNHQITPLAHFEIKARVLSTERYRFDRAAELSPVDFALGWGPMSDSKVLADVSTRQRDRWYFWSSARMPIPAAEISSHSANMHMIPATEAVARRLLAVRVGQLVDLQGQLIRADARDGWHWVSSLTRTDTGDGSCEVIWVESVVATDR